MNLNIPAITVHVHQHEDRQMAVILKRILRNTEIILMANKELLDLVAEIDAESNRIAAKLSALASQISTSMSADEVAEVKAVLSQEVADLKALGADPENPVPEPEPIEG